MTEQHKATINVSIPAEARDAFYAALATLKAQDGGLFTSASALIVKAVLDAAEHARQEVVPAATAQEVGRAHVE